MQDDLTCMKQSFGFPVILRSSELCFGRFRAKFSVIWECQRGSHLKCSFGGYRKYSADCTTSQFVFHSRLYSTCASPCASSFSDPIGHSASNLGPCCRPQPSDYELKSKKKGWMRFWTPFIKEKLEELTVAQQQLDDAQKDQVRPQRVRKAA